MSVGGLVVDIVKVSPGKWWVNTVDQYDLMHGGRTVAVYCDPLGEPLQVGDALWWQGGSCYWTPRVEPDGRSDVRLPKIGFSGVSHPCKQADPQE